MHGDQISELRDRVARLELELEQLKQTTLPPGLMGVGECAKYLSRSRKAIYMMVHKGQIPYRKQGSRVLFQIEKINRWIESFGISRRPGKNKKRKK